MKIKELSTVMESSKQLTFFLWLKSAAFNIF